EHDNRQAVVHAQGNGGRVHHLQPFIDHLEVGNLLVPRGGFVEQGVGRVNAVDSCALENHVGLHLHGAQRRRGIGGEVRIPGAGGKNYHAPFFQVPLGAPADKRLGDRPHFDGGHHARNDAVLFGGILHGEGVDHGGQHPHVVA